MKFNEKVYDKDHGGAVYLDEWLGEAGGGLHVSVDESENDTKAVLAAITLDDRGVRQLRLALTRYENRRKQ